MAYRLSDQHRVHGARVFQVPDSTLHESVALLEQRPFVPLSAEQATHLLRGANATLDSRLASDARDALAWAQEGEATARDPSFNEWAEVFRAEARTYRSVAAEALRLRGGRTTPYLVRGLALNARAGRFVVHSEGGDLAVFYRALTHGMAPTRRRPIVVYLESRPNRVCLGVLMVEE